MSERHEIALVISTVPDALNKLYSDEMLRVADAIIAAGYRRPTA